jgi:two-component system sensor histidine kinase/response regulator
MMAALQDLTTPQRTGAMLDWLFSNSFMPRGQVFGWRSDLVWMTVTANVAMAVAFFAIAIALAYFVRQRGHEVMKSAWWLVSAFALLCGMTFILNAITLWIPIYVVEAVIRVSAAIVCVITVPVVLRLIALALTLRSPAELERANEQLLAEAEMRRATEQELRLAHEEALQASRAKSGFLANMSHEIRTPMNAVMGMTAALLKTQLTPSQNEIAETIRSSSENLLAIINDVLDLSKIEAGAVSAEAADLQLSEVVEQAVLTLAERAQAKGLELITVVEPSIPPVVQGDARRLHQVLVNLASNAVKFTETGEVEVRASLESESEAGVVVRFSVRDTGIGILREARERLFQPFMQADNSMTRKYGGTGLGLAISKHLVEVMGGTINCESHTGQGTTFWFSVPMKRSAAATATAPDARNLRGMRALVVEDNETNLKVLGEQLSGWGLQVDLARDGAAALDKVSAIAFGGQPGYQFAIIDRSLPGTGGLELAGRLRQVPALADMHIILLHHMVGRDAATALQGAGVAAALTKPVRHSLLQHTMSVLVARAQLVPQTASAPTAGPSTPPPKSKPGDEPLPTKYRILVAEDNNLNQQVAKLQLRELGQDADYAWNGLEALEALSRKSYDLILMDCQMPELDGYDATAEIRRRERGQRHTWIIAMTAHAMVGDRDRCLAAGMDDYIAKPVSTEVLKDALERFAQRSPAIIDKKPMAAAAATPAAAAPLPKSAVATTDFAQLRQITKGNVALLRRLAELYVNQTAEQLAMLRAALSERSAADIQRIAHRCTGSSGTVGMIAMANLFEKLEQAGKNGQLNVAEQLTADIESAFVGVRASVKALASSPASSGA